MVMSFRQAKEIIENLRTAFIENVRQVDWMDNTTKKAAINKVDINRQLVLIFVKEYCRSRYNRAQINVLSLVSI